MPDRCKICDEVVKTNHEAHLRRVHGIYDIKLAVNQYFEPTSSSSTILTATQKPNSTANSPTNNKQKHTRSNKKGNQFS